MISNINKKRFFETAATIYIKGWVYFFLLIKVN